MINPAPIALQSALRGGRFWLAAAICATAGVAQAAPPPASGGDTPCFFINQWEGWKAPDDHTLYLAVNFKQVYKAELSGRSSLLQDPDAHIVSVTHGPETVCRPIDLELEVSAPPGIREPLIVKSLRKLTPEEVAALPPRERPF